MNIEHVLAVVPVSDLEAADGLSATRDELAMRGVDTSEIQPVNKGVELSMTTDPDGNAITPIGNFA